MGNELLVLPTGAWATLLVQVGQLAGALNIAQGRLTNASQATSCSDHGPPKTCTLLSEIGAVLQSAQQEILQAADTLATTVGALSSPGLLRGLVAMLEGSGMRSPGLLRWDVTSRVGERESLGSMRV